jgi:hypothetical protein
LLSEALALCFDKKNIKRYHSMGRKKIFKVQLLIMFSKEIVANAILGARFCYAIFCLFETKPITGN